MAHKILLIRPENIYNYNNYPPLGLINIGSVLKLKGYDVKIINCPLEKEPLKTIGKELKDCLFAGITLLTSEIPDAYRIIKFIKENSSIPVVVGGWHCTLYPDQMADCEYIDFVVAGEGEEHILEIADKLKDNIEIGSKTFHKKILDLEKLPIPDYSTDENIEHFISTYLTDKLSEYVTQPMRWLPYDSSRGCPSSCTFCINVVTGNTRYRKKSAGKVISEIEHIVKEYKLTHLKIIDDNFFVDIERVRKICTGIIKRELNITWDAECRCDYFNNEMLNDETLMLAKSSGLVQLTLGVESGSVHTLNLMKKNITPEQGEFAVRKCNEHGIIARSSLIIEIPGETREDIEKTIDFVKRLRKYPYFTCGVQTFRPYPKCELTEKLLKEGYLNEPKTFKEWTDKETINMYVACQYVRPWQVDGKYYESAAFYHTMESGVSLGFHLIDRIIDRLKYKSFIGLAKLRNKLDFYKFPIDKQMYKAFFINFYERKQKSEKASCATLSRADKQ